MLVQLCLRWSAEVTSARVNGERAVRRCLQSLAAIGSVCSTRAAATKCFGARTSDTYMLACLGTVLALSNTSTGLIVNYFMILLQQQLSMYGPENLIWNSPLPSSLACQIWYLSPHVVAQKKLQPCWHPKPSRGWLETAALPPPFSTPSSTP